MTFAGADKVSRVIREYFELRNSNGTTLAEILLGYPDYIQEHLSEMVLHFIRRTAARHDSDIDGNTYMHEYVFIFRSFVQHLKDIGRG